MAALVAVATIVVFVAGCGSDDDSGGGDDGGEVFTSSPIDVAVDDTFAIELEANPSTGYSWELAAPLDEAIVVSLGSDHEAGDSDAVGAPGTQQLSFKAVGEGSTTISLQYVRPWETDVAPAETQDFTVDVSS